MKHLEDTPWWICDPDDVNYCAYVDTDSNYFNAEPILRHLHSNFDEMSEKEKDKALESVALKYQDIITKHYDVVAKDVFNINQFEWFDKSHWLEMKTECVIRSAYFRATRRYAQWITKKDGVEKETLDIKGLEYKKVNFPPVFGEFFQKVLVDVLKGAKQPEIDKRVKEFKNQIFDGTIPLSDLGSPTSVKKLNKYSGRKARAGEMFSPIEKGAPAAVKATIVYNDLIKFWGLSKDYSYIVQGDKIRWVWLKPNPYQIDSIAFQSFDIPKKVRTFIEEYIDRNRIFNGTLLNKLDGFYSDLGWSLNLNPYKQKLFNL